MLWEWRPRGDCGRPVIPHERKCECGSEVVEFCHVADIEPKSEWPTIFVIDPHPRKPHMMIWVQVTPNDDLWQVAEAEVPGDIIDVKKVTEDVEYSMKLNVSQRLIDPNMRFW